MITVNVILAFSSGDSVQVALPIGSIVREAASRVSAPSASQYRVNGSPANASTALGNGDTLLISAGKVDAG